MNYKQLYALATIADYLSELYKYLQACDVLDYDSKQYMIDIDRLAKLYCYNLTELEKMRALLWITSMYESLEGTKKKVSLWKKIFNFFKGE